MTDFEVIKCQECKIDVDMSGFLDDSIAIQAHYETTGHKWYLVRVKNEQQ